MILAENEELPQSHLKIGKDVPKFILVDINEEEDRDKQAIQIWLNKRNRLWKMIFNRYCNTIRTTVDKNFEERHKLGKYMNIAEIFKFAKDHAHLPEHSTREELTHMIRAINIKKDRFASKGMLDYDGFLQLFIQTAHHVHRTKKKNFTVPLLKCLEQLLLAMAKAIMYKGGNTSLYEDPDFVVGMDKPKLKQLNKQVLLDPHFQPPEGFHKVWEREIAFEYSLPESLNLQESKKIAIETMDSLMNDLFGFHFIEARAFPTVVPKIKQLQVLAHQR